MEASPEPRVQEIPITQLIVDAQFNDWATYTVADIGSVLALRNQQSFYLGIREALPIGAQLAVILTVDTVTYEFVFDPRSPESAVLMRTTPSVLELGDRPVGVAINETGDQIEVRLPTPDINDEVISATLDQIAVRTDGGEELSTIIVNMEIPFVDEQDGIVYPGGTYRRWCDALFCIGCASARCRNMACQWAREFKRTLGRR